MMNCDRTPRVIGSSEHDIALPRRDPSEKLTWVASPRPLTGTDIRTLMDRTLWTRFGKAGAAVGVAKNATRPRSLAGV
jgi:hypothetical protein